MSDQNQISGNCGCCDEVKNLTPVTINNLPGLDAIAYRIGTHGSFMKTMLSALANEPELVELTTRETDDPSIGLLDAWSSVLDVLTFYQERIINEGFLRTATERRSILELARHISYKLRPGVAADTYLAFKMEEAPGAPLKAVIPAGTKTQSIPGQSQLPQVFETVEEIVAEPKLNTLKPQLLINKIPGFNDKEIYLNGIMTGLKPGDGLLMIGAEREAAQTSERWDFRKVKEVFPDPQAQKTKITWEEGLGWQIFGRKVLPAEKEFKIFALRQKANLFGYNAPDWRVIPNSVRDEFLPAESKGNYQTYNSDWPDLNIGTISEISEEQEITTIHLDNVYSKIVEDSWLVMFRAENKPYVEVYEVVTAVESARKNFTLASKTTAVTLKGENLRKKFNKCVRETVVFAQSEELEIAETPVTDPVEGIEIVLDNMIPELIAKKAVILSGKRIRAQLKETNHLLKLKLTDDSGNLPIFPGDSFIVMKTPEKQKSGRFLWTLRDKTGKTGTVITAFDLFSRIPVLEEDEIVNEACFIDRIKPESNPTTIILSQALSNTYERATVEIYANVAKATHGESKNEILGNGNGSEIFQKFELKQKPLTYISASSGNGISNTLKIRVNDILWKEVPTLYGCLPKDKVYVTRIADDGKVTVQFGDGITGSRLPTGVENIKASFRIGTGFDGLVDAGQISQLLSRPLGLKSVVNPLKTTGADNPEMLEKARRNAPLTVLSMERIVSLQDFEDFTRAFAGIGKARADLFWQEEQKIVFITIASANGGMVPESSDLFKHLLISINEARHNNYRVQTGSYRPRCFTLNAAVLTDENYIEEDVIAKVSLDLAQVFSFEKRDFGQIVTPSEVISVIQRVRGVIAVDLNLLDGKDPNSAPHFCITPEPAHWDNGKLLSAELLTIKPNGIEIHSMRS
jgi:hypothetical protein